VLSVLRHPRVLVLTGVLAAVVVALVVALAHSRTPGCSVAPPDVNLPPQLRSLGEFAQPFDTADQRTLTDAATRAATALHSDLAGAAPIGIVREAASGGAAHDALVVPLAVSSTGQRRVVGLVAFLLDCGGRAYYDDVDDLLRTDPSILPTTYPTPSAEQAAIQLGIATTPRLVYRDTPFHPLWEDPASHRTVPAGP
jgi:hypothetical protein